MKDWSHLHIKEKDMDEFILKHDVCGDSALIIFFTVIVFFTHNMQPKITFRKLKASKLVETGVGICHPD
jgi:hypothetical protein